ncbi:MAG: glycine cleavage system protein GcvH [Bacilli bacterium]
MSKILENLKYLKSHEWVKVEGSVAYIGITDHAQETLGSIVYLEAKEVGSIVTHNKEFGVVESVKAASDLLSPVSGKVIEFNEVLENSPEEINEDPYGSWIIKVEMSNPDELENLLDAKAYELECK